MHSSMMAPCTKFTQVMVQGQGVAGYGMALAQLFFAQTL